MLTYSFENRGRMPLYDYLYRCLKRDIQQGVLKAGEKLPSKRTLAQNLKVSVTTVENAYAQLAVEGYIDSIEKRGYYVTQLTAQPAAAKREIPPPAAAPKTKYLLDLQENRADPGRFPFSVWSRLMRQVLSERHIDLLSPMPYNGAEVLRRAIAGHLLHFRGMTVHPEQIVVGAGTEYLYTLLIQLLGRQRIFAVENPGYRKIAKIYAENGVQYRDIPLDAHGLSAAALRQSGAQVVHLSPAHHYPTGIVMPIQRRYELLHWANEQDGRYIIEDDYDSEFRFSGRPLDTLQSIDRQERVIYMNTFSKTLAPSIRISYMVLPPSLAAAYRARLGYYACTVPSFEQYTLARFIEEGYFEKHINRMKTFYRARRNQMIQCIEASPFYQRVSIREADAGLHFLLKIHTDLSDAQLKQMAAARGVRVSFLSDYAAQNGEQFAHIMVINYSGVDPEAFKKALHLFLP